MDGTGELRITMLGDVTATYDGAPVDLGGRRQRAVLTVLVLARGESVHPDRLAESVWGEDLPTNPAGALQSYVSHLRRRLSPGQAARTRSSVIVSQGAGYAVRLLPDAVDAWRFEAMLDQAADSRPEDAAALLSAALDLWQGPALSEYADEAWAQPEITRLTELRSVAREQLLDARLRRGEAALLVPELEAMVAEEPLREQRWRLLVLALYRAQRQADALSALRRARATLADELGVDPGPALRELEQEVLAQSPALEVPVQRGPAAGPPLVARPPSAGEQLVERDREVAVLRDALDGAAAGHARVVLVEGPAGIGKSRLLGELRQLAAERSLLVLTARGTVMERSFGFGAVRQLLEPALVGDQRDRLLRGSASTAAGVFDPTGVEQSDGSFAVLHALYWLTVHLSEQRPVVLAVDDLQWCDTPSLRYLAYLAHRLEGLPVLVAATVRTGEPHEDDDLLTDLASDGATLVVRPSPLSEEAIAAMVQERLGAPPHPLFVHACHRTTSGNPLLLRQLLHALDADRVRPDAAHADTVVAVGSRAVSNMVLMRLRRMPEDATAVAAAAAVLGQDAQLPALAALTGLAEARVAAALRALVQAEICDDEHPVGFVHPLVREAVYRRLSAAEREQQHEAAAALLEHGGASLERVAAHLELAPCRGHDHTVQVLVEAARTAAARGATESAVTHLRRALREPPSERERTQVLLQLGLSESVLDGPASVEHLLEAHPHIEDPATRARVATVLARTHMFVSPPGVATSFARAAAASLPAELDDARQGLVGLQRLSGFLHGLDPVSWRDVSADLPVGDGDGARMLAAALGFDVMLQGADRRRAVDLARFALHRDRLLDSDTGLFWGVAALTRMVADDDPGEVGDFWSRARAAAHAHGSRFAALTATMWQAHWHARRGDLAEALAGVGAARDLDRTWSGRRTASPYTSALEVICLLERGDLHEARRVVDTELALSFRGDGARVLRLAHGRLLVAEGRCREALEVVDGLESPVPIANPCWHPWRSTRARALAGLGERAKAAALVETEVLLLRRWGAPTYLGEALCLLGELRGSAGVEHLREAVAVLDPTAAALAGARARFALGSSPSVGDAEAVPLLVAAVDAAHSCGAVPLREQARHALVRRGHDTAACDAVAPALSRTERHIHELAGSGTDVLEIAQRLFLTPGAVQSVLAGTSAGAGR